MRRQEFDASFEGSRISTRRSYKDGLYIWGARKFSEHVATPRSVFLSHSPSIPRLYLSPPTPHIHRRPHVTTHRSRSEVSSSSSTFTTLPPCTPSTRRALLFYYSTRPRRVRLVASACIPGETSLLPRSLPLFLFLPLLLSLISSADRRSLLD